MDVKHACVARADEEGRGVNGGERGNLERGGIHSRQREMKRHEGCAVVEQDAAMARAQQHISVGQGEHRGQVAGLRVGGEELANREAGSGLGFKDQHACSAGGKEKLRLTGSAETAAGDAVDRSDGELEAAAEVEARRAVGAQDGEAGWAAEVEVAQEKYSAVVSGLGGYGLRAEVPRQVGRCIQGAQGEGELASRFSISGCMVECPSDAENHGECHSQHKGKGDYHQQQAPRFCQATETVLGFHFELKLRLRLRL